ncbi:MAG TPA: trimethylamine methyltransferase family protein, partial [Thermoleophilia bacterium]|nr:trimethylamine methyltransferase family protein [Thermoleophilia bacterium]
VVHSAEQTDLDPLLRCARGGLACAWLTQAILDPDDAATAGLVAGVTAFHAAALAACTVQQLAAPRSPFAVPALPAAIELHAPAFGSGAEYAAAFGAVAQLAAHAGLPVTSGFPLTRTAADEWSAAAEAAFALQAAALGGAALVAGAGHTDRGTVYSPAQLVLDAETWSNVAAVAAGIEVDDESIALDTIAAIGIGGNALAQKHTRRHMKDVWRPRLFDRSAYDVWDREGRPGAHERAAALAGDLVAGHEVPLLDAEKAATLRRIIETAGL